MLGLRSAHHSAASSNGWPQEAYSVIRSSQVMARWSHGAHRRSSSGSTGGGGREWESLRKGPREAGLLPTGV